MTTTTDPPASLAAALAALQTRLPQIPKASKAQYGNYADLADISSKLLPVMGNLGLSFSARPTWVLREDGTREFVLVYKLRHVSGESDEGEYPLVAADKAVNHQQLGGAITYGRRYALCAITGAVADDDDDGQTAATAGPVAAKQPRAKPPERASGNLPRNADGSTSRSRTTDAELAASGQMTDQQIRGHNQLERDVKGTGPQGTARLSETPPDDPFYDQPKLRVPTPANPRGAIFAHFNRLAKDDEPFTDEQRYGAMSTITGRVIKSTNDLTSAEGPAVIEFLSKRKNRAALIEALAVKAGEDSA